MNDGEDYSPLTGNAWAAGAGSELTPQTICHVVEELVAAVEGIPDPKGAVTAWLDRLVLAQSSMTAAVQDGDTDDAATRGFMGGLAIASLLVELRAGDNYARAIAKEAQKRIDAAKGGKGSAYHPDIKSFALERHAHHVGVGALTVEGCRDTAAEDTRRRYPYRLNASGEETDIPNTLSGETLKVWLKSAE